MYAKIMRQRINGEKLRHRNVISRLSKYEVYDSKQTRLMKVYVILVYTSDVSGSGTDADVFIVLYGRDGAVTEKTSLCPTKDERKSKFNKKSVDTVCTKQCFTFTFKCFANLYSRIGFWLTGCYVGFSTLLIAVLFFCLF